LQERDRSLALLNLELRRQATHDALTGLANRVLFIERLEQAVRDGQPFAVCAIDLDGFKEVNDTRGHGAGDELLRSVAERLRSSVRSDDTVARSGGDEFLILLRNVYHLDDAAAQAIRCTKMLAAPYRIGDDELSVSSSVGVARCPIDANTAGQLMARADEAMYAAKRSGKDTFRLYDPNAIEFHHGSTTTRVLAAGS
jgi:diguanylate cyclase (GGDEF)-like protein